LSLLTEVIPLSDRNSVTNVSNTYDKGVATCSVMMHTLRHITKQV